MTADDVLAARADTREMRIRTIGPALVIVIEQEAPTRLQLLASSESEMQALGAWMRLDEHASGLLDAYADRDPTNPIIASRLDAHVTRLANSHQT